jgi:cell shape-determining protein MreC
MSASNELVKLAGTAGGGASLTALVTWFANRRKVPAEVDSIIVQGANTAVIALTAVNEALERRVLYLEEKLAKAQTLLDELREELSELRDIH